MRRMDDYQEEKDNPRKHVVAMDMEELYATHDHLQVCGSTLTNDSFRTRFKSLIDQYELRELHFHSQMRTKELEVQYHSARYEAEKKKYEEEASRTAELSNQVETFVRTEGELRQQLNVYVDKFKQVSNPPAPPSPYSAAHLLTSCPLIQVEETLNNSNDLFLTFRKEMEDMSKKTKRLERENETLKRKHDQVKGNIIKMAEERNKYLAEIEDLKKKLDKLNGIIKQMQQQGRGIPQGLAGTVENGYVEGEGDDLDGDESEYEEDEYDEGEDDEEVSDDGEEYDDETEDEAHHHHQPQTYGPERPPPPPAAAAVAATAPTTNGHR